MIAQTPVPTSPTSVPTSVELPQVVLDLVENLEEQVSKLEVSWEDGSLCPKLLGMCSGVLCSGVPVPPVCALGVIRERCSAILEKMDMSIVRDLGGALTSTKAVGIMALDAADLGSTAGCSEVVLGVVALQLMHLAIDKCSGANRSQWLLALHKYGDRCGAVLLGSAALFETVQSAEIVYFWATEPSTAAAASVGHLCPHAQELFHLGTGGAFVFAATGAVACGVTALKWWNTCKTREAVREEERPIEKDATLLEHISGSETRNIALFNFTDKLLERILKAVGKELPDHIRTGRAELRRSNFDELKEQVINDGLCNKCRVEMSPGFYLWCFPSGVSDRVAKKLFGLEAFDLLFKTLPALAFDEATDTETLSNNLGFALNPDTMDKSVYLIVDKDIEEQTVFERSLKLTSQAITDDMKDSGPPKPNWLSVSSENLHEKAGPILIKLITTEC